MPLVANSRWLGEHPHVAISADLLDQVSALIPSLSPDMQCRVFPTLKNVEAYLQLTRQTLTAEVLRNKEQTRSLCEGFIGAAYSPIFQGQSLAAACRQGKTLLTLVNRLGLSDPEALRVKRFSAYVLTPDVTEWMSRFEIVGLDEDAKWLWRGWTTPNKAGRVCGFDLYGVYARLGREFTQRLFEALRKALLGSRSASIHGVAEFCQFIASLPPEIQASHFDDPYFVDDFFVQFIRYFFSTVLGRGLKIESQLSHWNYGFLHFANKYLFDQVMTHPARPLPHAPRMYRGCMPRISTNDHGTSISTTLLTHIPLEISDSSAREMLFNQIQTDFDRIVAWARVETELLWAAHQRRLELAPRGTIRHVYTLGGERKRRLGLTCPTNPDWLANAAATYEANGHFGARAHAEKIFPAPMIDTSRKLGLPVDGALLPHAALLVAMDPKITCAFLEELELYDRHGKQTGFVELDGVCYLVGRKRRRGPRLAQQEIALSDSTKEIVEQVIQLTSPLRNYLRRCKSSHWRKLFLTVSSVAGMPHMQNFSAQTSTKLDDLASRFITALGLNEHDALDIAKRFSLRALRASAGVIVYLRTKSVTDMARALGHNVCSPNLLDHYLPRPIQVFFQDRWIRIFQSALICEAMKDSDYLLESSPFQTMDELDAFLGKHALKQIPKHIIDPDDPVDIEGSAPESTKVVFGISNGVMTALLSLELAVRAAVRRPSGRAVYWSGVAHRLCEYLATLDDRPDLTKCLKWAREHASANAFGEFIYG
ncbi:hypothetical protein [Rhodanobacter soli]